MTFPNRIPTSRKYSSGNWPVRTFNAQDGAEVRILYGNRRFGHSLTVSYDNIPDADAESFINHYLSTQGTYQTFAIPAAINDVTGGWEGSDNFFNAGIRTQYRYAEPPELTSVYPGVSTVKLKLVAVLLPTQQ